MNDKATAREIQESIARVLMEDWDPIGVRDEPQAAAEYDSYVGPVYHLLASGADANRIAEHLASVERELMGFERSRIEALLAVAEKLVALDVRRRPTRNEHPDG